MQTYVACLFRKCSIFVQKPKRCLGKPLRLQVTEDTAEMQRKMQSKQVCCVTVHLNPAPVRHVIHMRPSEQASLPATVHMPHICVVKAIFGQEMSMHAGTPLSILLVGKMMWSTRCVLPTMYTVPSQSVVTSMSGC